MRHRIDAGWALLLALLVVASALILYLGRDFTFYSDEWFFVLYRDGNSWDNVLAGHGGHLSLFPVLLFVGIFKTVGLDSYWVYQVVALTAVLLCASLVYALARRRVGPMIALIPAALLLFLGSGWEDILRPFQIVFTAAIACGLLAILLLDRDDLRGDAASCGLLVAGMCWSAAAVPFVVAVSVGLIVKGRFWRRVWVPLIPAAIYPLWSPTYSDVHTDYWANVGGAPWYAARMVEEGVAGMTGLPHWMATAVLLAFAVVVGIRLKRIGRTDALVWEAFACGATFWMITALSQAHEQTPEVPRYLFVSAVILCLIAVGAAKGVASRRAIAAVAVLGCCLAIPSNVVDLVRGADYMERTAQLTRAELGAMQLAHQVVAPTYTPPLEDLAGITIPAAPYFAAVGRFQSTPADSPAEIAREPEFARQRADQILAMAFDVRLKRAPQVPESVRARGCTEVSSVDPGVAIMVPRPGVLLRLTASGTARISLRQFAHSFPVDLGVVRGSSRMFMRPDHRSFGFKPWVLRVEASGGPATVCRLGPYAAGA
jgi:hypothetical protein